jgi:DNA-binding PadR family transcriptional regulator
MLEALVIAARLRHGAPVGELELRLLLALMSGPKERQPLLAATQVPANSIDTLLKRLRKKGYVSSAVRSGGDCRARWAITPEGRSAVDRHQRRREVGTAVAVARERREAVTNLRRLLARAARSDRVRRAA